MMARMAVGRPSGRAILAHGLRGPEACGMMESRRVGLRAL